MKYLETKVGHSEKYMAGYSVYSPSGEAVLMVLAWYEMKFSQSSVRGQYEVGNPWSTSSLTEIRAIVPFVDNRLSGEGESFCPGHSLGFNDHFWALESDWSLILDT